MSNVASVSLGGYHSACITENGELYTWGCNSYGRLGNGSTAKSKVPIKITIPTTATEESLSITEETNGEISTSDSGVTTVTGLLPNEVYNIYSMCSRTADEPFSDDNLLYIEQGVSDSSGTLTFTISSDKSAVNPQIFVKALNGGEVNNAQLTKLSPSGTSVKLAWEAAEGAEKYTVYTVRNGIFVKEADVSGTSYTVTDLVKGTEYGFIVQTHINGEESVLKKSEALFIMLDDEKTIEDYIEIVNGITDDTAILTDEELEAVEKVLEYDYSKAA